MPNLRRLFNIDIPAGRAIVFAPGGYHILLRNLKKPLVAGDKVNINLSFENAGDVSADFSLWRTGLPRRRGDGFRGRRPRNFDL